MSQLARVRHGQAADARDIANEVMLSYAQQREQRERERASALLDRLEAEVRTQEDLVEEKRRLFHTIVKAVGVPYLEGVEGSGDMGRIEEEVLRKGILELAEAERSHRQKEIEVKNLLRFRNGTDSAGGDAQSI